MLPAPSEPPSDSASEPRTAPISNHDRVFLTVAQAAALLHLSESSQTLRREVSVVRAYIRQGELKAFRVADLRKVLIPREELLKLLAPVQRVSG